MIIKSKNEKNIAICCDENLLDYALFNFMNIFLQSDSEINFHLVLDKISEEQKIKIDKLSKIINEKYGNNSFFSYDFSKYGFEKFKPSSEQSHVNENTYLRIYLDKILPTWVNEILYIDVDTYAVGDINEIFNFCSGKEINFGRFERFEEDDFVISNINNVFGLEKKLYVNAGVVFLNLELIRKNSKGDEMVKFAKKYESKLLLADQDLLNAVIDFDPFPPEFNLGSSEWGWHLKELNMSDKFEMIHFFSNVKPWDIDFNIEKYLETNNIFSMSKKDVISKKEHYISWRNKFEKFKNDFLKK